MALDKKLILSELKKGRDKHVRRRAVLEKEMEFQDQELRKFDEAIEALSEGHGSSNYLIQATSQYLKSLPPIPEMPVIAYVKEIHAIFNVDKRKWFTIREVADKICEAYEITYNQHLWDVRRRVESQAKRWVKIGVMEMAEGKKGWESKKYKPTKEWK